ncbi:hypothetical protein ACFFK0_06115 [Paenibacillus chartarius]|uniref:Uncharacterized protein n=1 Tax=Paenibacillus chartarius TaxID=747481 RepID=A0ABV6DHB4_9BACL
MSEFTYGNLIRFENKTLLLKYLSAGTPYIQLNDEWLAFFTEEDGEQRSSDFVKKLSEHCPILYFYNLEDHFWGFEILHQGDLMSSCHFSYDLESELLFDIARDRFPDKGEIAGFLFNSKEGQDAYEQIQAELRDPVVFEREVRKHFETVCADDFQLFGINEESIDELHQLLSADTYLNREFDAIDRFKNVLNLNEMSWIRFERTEDRDNVEYV